MKRTMMSGKKAVSILLVSLSFILETQATSCVLAGTLGFKALAVNSAQYTVLNTNRWSETSILSPACITVPSSVQDVSTIMRVLAEGAKQNFTGCTFAVKSGGHNPNPGANDINGGVTIDLARLNNVTTSPTGDVIQLGVGSTWQNAYNLVPNLLFPGGLCGDTGVGGVSLGGGMSLLFSKVGWVADQIVEYEIVLANGTIAIVNKSCYPDLFQALKGGGSNFGILTAIKLNVYAHRGSIYAGQILNAATPNATRATVNALTTFVSANNKATNDGVQCAFIYSSDGKAVIDNFIANTDDQENSPALAPFYALPDQLAVTVGHANMSTIGYEASNVQPHGYRDLTATLTFENSAMAMSAVQNVSQSVFFSVNGTVPSMDFIIFYIPLPRAVVYAGQNAGSTNVFGLDASKDRISVSLNPRWLNSTYDNIMYQAARTWVSQAEQALNAIGKLDPFLYLNYAAPWQKPFQGYGQQNLQFLRRTAAAYDPKGIFQAQMPGSFHLS